MANTFGHEIGIDRSNLTIIHGDAKSQNSVDPWVVNNPEDIHALYECVRRYAENPYTAGILGTLFEIDLAARSPDFSPVSMILPPETSTLMVNVLHKAIASGDLVGIDKKTAGNLLGSMPKDYRHSAGHLS